MWYSPIGITVTILVGYLASVVIRRISREAIREPDPSLFTPFVAARIRKRRATSRKITDSQDFVLESSESISKF